MDTEVEKADLGQLCLGLACVYSLGKPNGGEVSARAGRSALPSQNPNLLGAESAFLQVPRGEVSFWAQSQKMLYLPRVIGLFLSKVRTVE